MSKNKYKASNLISMRDDLIDEIKKEWTSIQNLNIYNKTYKTSFNCEESYKKIKELEQELVKIKLGLQILNLGLNSIKELTKNCIYEIIFKLTQLKDRKLKLSNLLKQIKEYDKKLLKTSVIQLSDKFIKSEIESLSTEILTIEEELNNFNKNKTIEL